jgi:ubiquinone/menaquinone biosynthesis C-methylase UbiE
MTARDEDQVFAGSIPELYDTPRVPLIFEPYAVDLAARVRSRTVSRLLEVAAGTGVVTRTLASSLPTNVSIVATDLNQTMLDRARSVGTSRPVEWRQADASQLPFPDGAFDAIVCQFGVMFFPDKVQAFADARRVLASGGVFIFNVWDSLAENEFADVVTAALERLFPADPPRFMARTPHGYHDQQTIRRDLLSAGFGAAPRITTIAVRSRAISARAVAIAYCQGTPLRNEIERRDPAGLGAATDSAEAALIQRFGRGTVDGKIQALAIEVER